MNAQDIRKTINMLENSSMELVANRDFDLEDTTTPYIVKQKMVDLSTTESFTLSNFL